MKFCVVYPYATWFSGKSCGGAEKQVGLLAQHLAHRGHEVTFLALDSRSPERQVDGVRIRVPWRRGEGVPLLRVATHKLPGLRRLVRETDADVYYLRGAQALSRWVISEAHAAGARALLGLASDRNLDPSSGRMLVPFGHGPLGGVTGPLAWRLLQRSALHAADVVIAQNEQQAARCAQMGLSHELVPSIVEPPAPRLLESATDYDVFWAGNVHNASRRGKGVEPLLTLVKSLPATRFAIVGALKDASLSGVLMELRESPNADLFGRLAYDETQALLARSRLVLNTSPVEGFSNVMLEGWALGRPSLTLAVNPSGLLSEGRWPPAERPGGGHQGMLGTTAGGDVRTLVRLVGEALGDAAALRRAGRRCRDYITAVHDPDAVCARYEDLAVPPCYTRQRGLPI